MNDIYEHKAKKYKYKYLKLKKELEGGVRYLDYFEKKDKIKEKTVEILKKTIKDVINVITPKFNNSKILGLTYSENGYTIKKSTKFYTYNNIEDIKEMMKKYDRGVYEFYPPIIKYFDCYVKKKYNEYEIQDKINKHTYYNNLTKIVHTDNETRIFDIIAPIIKNLDIYMIIMFIKKLFYFSSKFDKKTNELVKELENDAYENKIVYPSPKPPKQELSKDEITKFINEQKDLQIKFNNNIAEGKNTLKTDLERSYIIKQILIDLINEQEELQTKIEFNKNITEGSEGSDILKRFNIIKGIFKDIKSEYIVNEQKELEIQKELKKKFAEWKGMDIPEKDLQLKIDNECFNIIKEILLNSYTGISNYNKDYDKNDVLTNRIQEIIDSISTAPTPTKK
jgi:hypothetical protein